jgi:hypothetical protein
VASVRKWTIPTEGPQVVNELVPISADRGCRVVSVTDPYGHILSFVDQAFYNIVFQIKLFQKLKL